MRVALLLILTVAAFTAPPDSVVEAAIRAKFAKSKISTNNFRVSVKSGVALLEGKTDVPQHKGVATRLARTGGAREVVNKIQIGEAARKKLSDRLQKARETRASKPVIRSIIQSKSTPVAAAVASKPPATPVLRRMQIKH